MFKALLRLFWLFLVLAACSSNPSPGLTPTATVGYFAQQASWTLGQGNTTLVPGTSGGVLAMTIGGDRDCSIQLFTGSKPVIIAPMSGSPCVPRNPVVAGNTVYWVGILTQGGRGEALYASTVTSSSVTDRLLKRAEAPGRIWSLAAKDGIVYFLSGEKDGKQKPVLQAMKPDGSQIFSQPLPDNEFPVLYLRDDYLEVEETFTNVFEFQNGRHHFVQRVDFFAPDGQLVFTTETAHDTSQVGDQGAFVRVGGVGCGPQTLATVVPVEPSKVGIQVTLPEGTKGWCPIDAKATPAGIAILYIPGDQAVNRGYQLLIGSRVVSGKTPSASKLLTAGDKLAVLGGDTLTVYDQKLTELASQPLGTQAQDAVVDSTGNVWIAAGGKLVKLSLVH